MARVSIILPTFNRAHFLENAFISLQSQSLKDWELIIVDDGSSDDTHKVLSALQEQYNFNLKTITQDNQGPAVARNTGIKLASAETLAFFDSDDTWEPDHLQRAVKILDKYREIDWIYFACRRIEKETNAIELASTFYNGTQPNPLFSCATPLEGSVYLLNNNEASLVQINEGIDSGLQNSVIRKKVLEQIPLPNFRIGEDRLFILQALKAGFGMAFEDRITVNYMIHDQNSSDTNKADSNYAKRISTMKKLIESYEATPQFVILNEIEQKALNTRLAEDYFWKLGYALELENKQYWDALSSMKAGIKLNPMNLKFWKTALLTLIKALIR